MSLPEGPKDLKIWQMVQWIATPISFMRRCRRRFGDRFTVKLTRELPPVVFFSDPKALQMILTNDDSELFEAPGELNVLLQPLLGTQSVIGLSGEPHRRMRQLLMPSFHGERMRAYWHAVCSETLRICPVGMLTFPRVTKSRVELTGASLDPGTLVVGCIYLAHHREEVYPDPDAFRPERFLERRYSPYEYLPFGGGARRCIGMAFAQFEMKIVLNAILSAVELAHADARPVRLVRRGLTSGPSPFRMVVKRRTRQFAPPIRERCQANSLDHQGMN
jgi:cytochrome P450